MWMINKLIASNSCGLGQVGIGGMAALAYSTWVFSESLRARPSFADGDEIRLADE